MVKFNRPQIKVVQEIIDQAIMNNKPHYLIKWKDLPHEKDTWQSVDNLQNIIGKLQKWIRKRRQGKEKQNMDNISSFCDTVNYAPNAQRKQYRKKINNKPKMQQKSVNNEIVLIQEQQQEIDEQRLKNLQTIFQSSSQIQSQSESNQIRQTIEQQQKKNIIQQQTDIRQKQQSLKEIKQKRQSLQKGMKVIGRVTAEDIVEIVSHFQWKSKTCYKVQLRSNGSITNMRQEDLKKLCPQMLMEYFQDNGINDF